jgi:hypothetical protein
MRERESKAAAARSNQELLSLKRELVRAQDEGNERAQESEASRYVSSFLPSFEFCFYLLEAFLPSFLRTQAITLSAFLPPFLPSD